MIDKRDKEFINLKLNSPAFKGFKDGQRYYSISTYLKDTFGSKTIKLAIDGGFTCPNRDGKVGTGGCIFCSDSGSGEFASDIDTQIELLSQKWPNSKYLAYFQNHTNTYAPVDVLRKKYEKIISNPKIEGLVIGTRPDCLGEDVLELLSEINENHFLWVELGLQSMHDKTSKLINRCYDLRIFENAMNELKARNIKTVVHIILGLPGETKQDMLDTVEYVSNIHPFGIKLHLLNVVKNSPMEHEYSNYMPFESIEDYVKLVVKCLERISPDITIHRLTGDAPRSILISPPWSYMKRTILNGINDELRKSHTFQGRFAIKK